MSMIGKTLAHYQVTREIGKGGMGKVYQAKDQKLGRDVAIKVLPEEFARDADRVDRFQREAKLLASLNHPNIAAIHGLEESDGIHFLVMELIEGDTLADRIRTGRIPIEEALKLALQIAEALEAAHEKGVIHRDLKPANIKVTPDGKVKVLDFGLAKAYAGGRKNINLSNTPTLSDAATQQGVIMGTAAYMSPEQARGESVDKRADIWAFGVVLFEMLTGIATFEGRSVTDVLASVLKTEPEWKQLPPNLHPRIRLLLERSIEKETKNRYHDIADVRADIQKVLADPSGVFAQPATVVERRSGLRAMLPWIAAIILVGLIVGLAVWQLKTTEPPQVTSFYHELPEGQQFNAPLPLVVGVSPDGRKFLYCANDGLFLRSIGEMDAQLIAGTADDIPLWPFFSPDGEWIVYFSISDRKLKKIAMGGRTPIALCDVAPPFFEGSWAGDKIIFSAMSTPGVMQVSTRGGTAETLFEHEEDAMFLGPQMLPDGKSVLVTKQDAQQNTTIMVRSLESGETKEITAGAAAHYLPTGHLVYTKGNDIGVIGGHAAGAVGANLFAVPFDLDTLEITGDPVPMVDDVSGWLGWRYAVSESGTLAYVPGTPASPGRPQIGYTLAWVDCEGREEKLNAPRRIYLWPKISPDGTRMALGIYNIEDRVVDIWIWDFRRESLTRLTHDGANTPLWTPDGKKIVYGATLDDVQTTYWRNADGTGKVEKLYSEANRTLIPWSFTSDGKYLVVSVIEGEATVENNNWDVGILSMEGNHELKPLLHEEYIEATPQISPDGQWIAYTSNAATGEAMKGNEVYLQPFPDVDKGKWQVSNSGGGSPRWSPDSRELYYLTEDNVVMAVTVQTKPNFSLGTPMELFKSIYIGVGPTSGIPFDIHPDDKRFLMINPRRPRPKASEEDHSPPQRKINIVLNWFEELKERVPVD
jgi:serine/threonine protein kinase/Tol biopolymer transport system component